MTTLRPHRHLAERIRQLLDPTDINSRKDITTLKDPTDRKNMTTLDLTDTL